MQFSRNTTDWWLAHWVTDAGNNYTNATNLSKFEGDALVFEASDNDSYDVNSYLKIYVGFAVMNTVFTFFRAFIFAYGGITAATKFHKLLLKSVMRVSK